MSNVLTPAAVRGEAHSEAGAPAVMVARARVRVLCQRAALVAVLASAVVGAPVALAATASERASSGEKETNRAYELVSPVDKLANSVDPRSTVQSTADGDGVAYAATSAFAGAETSVVGTMYLGRRSDRGWSVDPLDAPQINTSYLINHTSIFLSDDLSRTFQFSARALAPGAFEGGGNLYLRDNATGARSLVAATDKAVFAVQMVPATSRNAVAAAGDLTHVAFTSVQPFLPDRAVGVPNAYEYAGGALRLVGRLPDGSIDPGGSQIGDATSHTPDHHAMSEDGQRIFFKAPADIGALYVREGGERTIAISVSRRAGDTRVPQAATFNAASKDGSIVYFTSAAYLTDDNSGGLYRYDLNTDTLEHVTPVTDPDEAGYANISRVLGASSDGSAIAFIAGNDLTGDGPTYGPNLYVYKNGVLTFLGAVAAYEAGGLSVAKMSPDGRYFAFSTVAPMTGADVFNDGCGSGPAACTDMFVFDAQTRSLACVTCGDPKGNRNSGTALVLGPTISEYTSRAVLDNGTVFYSSAEGLVPGDVNGRSDVYEWRDGVNRLISSGTSPDDSYFADASADGRDVFFETSQRLVSVDADDEMDVYDARVGGGIAAQNPSPVVDVPCAGDGCQGAPRGGPGSPPSIGSVTLSGPGDGSAGSGESTGRVTVAKVKVVEGVSATIRVKVPGKGKIAVSGSGLVGSSKTAKAAGSYQLAVELSQQARRTLARKHQVKVRVSVQFRPAAGNPATAHVSVTFRPKAKKKASKSSRRVTVLSSDARRGR